jgi:hypothetical protein
MDFLLILLAIGGLVVAGVMLVLASRASRMQRESDTRVETLQALATGSVLFAADTAEEFTPGTVATRAAAGFDAFPLAADEFDEFTDEAADRRRQLTAEEPPAAARSAPFERPAHAYPFVLTVPAGGRPVVGSFERAQHGRLT